MENGLHGLHMEHVANLVEVDKELDLDHALTQHQVTMELTVQAVQHKLHHATHKTVLQVSKDHHLKIETVHKFS